MAGRNLPEVSASSSVFSISPLAPGFVLSRCYYNNPDQLICPAVASPFSVSNGCFLLARGFRRPPGTGTEPRAYPE